MSRLALQRVDANGAVIASAIGSGFFWEFAGTIHLITNWHNVTGVNPITNRMMSGAFFPNRIQFSYCRSANDASEMFYFDTATVDLYRGDFPQWLEHPLGREVDCVSIPVSFPDDLGFKSVPMNRHSWQDALTAAIGMECFIIGYPKGLTGPGATPIWKRASIASEPSLDYDEKPVLLVDTASRPGMSGSPVILRHHGVFAPDGIIEKSFFGTVQNFLGIYSGRLGDDDLGVQLGRIWKGYVVDQIIKDGHRGIHPNEVI